MVKRNKNRGIVQNKKEILNTKLYMPSRLKRNNKEKKLKKSISRSSSNKLIKNLSNFRFDNFNDCVFIKNCFKMYIWFCIVSVFYNKKK